CDEGSVLLGDNMECKIRVAGELNASVDEKDSLAQVWHKRLGHISEAGLHVLETQGLFDRESLDKLDFCEYCVVRKSHRVRFVVGRHTTQEVIYYVHSDLWGPSQMESLGGKRYFLSILDDYSGRVWVYILRNVVFNESVMYKDTLKDSGAGDKSVEELQVEVELQRFNNHTPEEDQIDQEDGDDEDAGDHETDQTPDLTDYQLAQDRERMTRTKPLRFRDESNMVAYAFAAAEEEDTHEPLTYQDTRKVAMKEEMDSLRKNKTWELVDHPAGQKL
ncbi:retrovirus-related pol polyprotein from transposon TNT 1-94, partial [Tanacetum coccineum]